LDVAGLRRGGSLFLNWIVKKRIGPYRFSMAIRSEPTASSDFDSCHEYLRRPINHQSEYPRDCYIPVPKNILRDGAVCHGRESAAVQSGKQHASVTVAHIGLSSGRLHQPGHDRLEHAARSVSPRAKKTAS
jgi:hypothetical protein